MSFQPLITFKAGICDLSEDGESKQLVVRETPGFVYLYTDPEDELTHFCWTPRASTTNEPELDLMMFPGDGTFTPYRDPKANTSSSSAIYSPTNGRIFRLKFSSSGERKFFWLQSKPTHPSGKANYFSERDLKLGTIVNDILQGEEVDVRQALASSGTAGGDEDEEMGDADQLHRTSTGGAGPDATGGNFEEEGEDSRRGGADGARAAAGGLSGDANDAVQNFLRSLGGGGSAQRQQQQPTLFTTLPDLLTPEICVATLKDASPAYIDTLLSNLPPQLLTLAQSADDLSSFPDAPTTAETAAADMEALSLSQKKDLLRRVFHSPQLHQSLGSLTMALRDGGLPMVSQAMGIKVENGGLIRGGAMPLGEGKAVEAFLDGVKETVKQEERDKERKGEGSAKGGHAWDMDI